MIKIEEIIDYSLIKDKEAFNKLIEQRKNKINVTINFEHFNIDNRLEKDYEENLNYYKELYENIKHSNKNNVETFIFVLKEYLAVREILVDKKYIKTSEYIYRLF